MSDYTIGSFNICKFNYAGLRKDGKGKDFDRIADIIRNEHFDIIAIQEAKSESAIRHLVKDKLGELEWDWKWALSDNHDKYDDGYAFIWNKRRFRLVNSTQHENPRVYESVTISKDLKSRGCAQLIRPPFVAEFTPQGQYLGGPNLQFRLINTHIAWEKPHYVEGDFGDITARKNELAVLSEEIYRRVSMTRGGMLVPYTFLMGDYNLCLVGTGGKIEAVIPIEEGRNLRTVQTELTTLKRPKTEELDVSNEGDEVVLQDGDTQLYASNYDHFSYDTVLDSKMTLRASRVDSLFDYYKNDVAKHRAEVSDHVPIKLEITLR